MPSALLQDIRRELGEVTPLAIVMGAGLGAGMTSLMVGPLSQSSDLALEALALIGLQIFGPVGVALIWTSRRAALQVARITPWRRSIAAASLSAMALLPYFLGALLLAGMLITPRDDLGSEVDRLLGSLDPWTLPQSLLRTALLTGAAAAVCHRKARQLLRAPQELPRLVADATTECFLVVVVLEVVWILLIDPFRITLR